MKKILSVLLVMLISIGFIVNDAMAKRFGGGRSFGVSRNVSSFSMARPVTTQANNTVSPMRRWAGPLAGLALGGLLGHFLFGQGFGPTLLNFLIIGGLLFFIINWFKSRMVMATQPKISDWMKNSAAHAQPIYSGGSQNFPAGFHEESFLRDAKRQFLELQAAYDQKDLSKLQETTTPGVFSEIKAQLEERGNAINHTEVVRLNLQVLDVTNEQQLIAGNEREMLVASVLFSGLIKENAEPVNEFKEIWHLQKAPTDLNWVVAGIQQS